MLAKVIKRLLYQQLAMANQWRRLKLTVGGVNIHPTCKVNPQVSFHLGFAQGTPGDIHIASQASLGQGAILDAWGGKIVINENVFLGPYVVIYGHGGVTIGENTLIAMHCRILSSNHTIPDQNTLIRSQPDILLPTNIGKDVWLGAGVTVLGGVTIGDGCVVGAGAVVTKDLAPYSIAMGVPAKVVKMRSE